MNMDELDDIDEYLDGSEEEGWSRKQREEQG